MSEPVKHFGEGKYGFREHDLILDIVSFNWYDSKKLRDRIFARRRREPGFKVRKVDR